MPINEIVTSPSVIYLKIRILQFIRPSILCQNSILRGGGGVDAHLFYETRVSVYMCTKIGFTASLIRIL